MLYAMVCGFLPYEDPKTSNLYKKILSADYTLPKFLSNDCRGMIQGIFKTNPEERFKIEDIRVHPWYRQIQERKAAGLFPGKEQMPVNPSLFNSMIEDYGFEREYAQKCIEANRHNHITATFHLLYKRAIRGKVFEQMNQEAKRTSLEPDELKKQKAEMNQTIPVSFYVQEDQNPVQKDESSVLSDNQRKKDKHRGQSTTSYTSQIRGPAVIQSNPPIALQNQVTL